MHHSTSLSLLLLNAPWVAFAQNQQPLARPQSSSLEIPPIGLGLWNTKSQDATNAVKHAFETGYQHFDSAAAYYNEEYVGAGLNDAASPARDTYWVTSKLWNDMHQPDNVPKALAKTLHDLNTTYLDLYLMHWPVAFLPGQEDRQIIDQDTTIQDTWRAMEKLIAPDPSNPAAGTTRYIGVSNFSPRDLTAIFDMCTVCPYAHEFETHPYLQQQQFVNWHADHNVTVIAYSPLANTNPTYADRHPDLPKLLEDPFWLELAGKKNVSTAQAVLGWALARGTVVIPKSANPDHIRDNFGAAEVEFTPEELEAVAGQDQAARFNNPGKGWGVNLFDGLDDGYSRF